MHVGKLKYSLHWLDFQPGRYRKHHPPAVVADWNCCDCRTLRVFSASKVRSNIKGFAPSDPRSVLINRVARSSLAWSCLAAVSAEPVNPVAF
jgi:hypothetical protein